MNGNREMVVESQATMLSISNGTQQHLLHAMKRHSNKTMEMRMFSLAMALSFVCTLALGACSPASFFCFVSNSLSNWRVAKVLLRWKLCCHSFMVLSFVSLFLVLFLSLSPWSVDAFIDGTFSILFERMCRSLNGSIISILLLITNEIRHALKTTPKMACIQLACYNNAKCMCRFFNKIIKTLQWNRSNENQQAKRIKSARIKGGK